MRSALAVLLLLAAAGATAQPALTLIDLERTKVPLYDEPRHLTAVDGRLIAFIAGPQFGRHHANQLWLSDGTFAGTRATGIDNVARLAAAGTKLFYLSADSMKLWRYDIDTGTSTLLHDSTEFHQFLTSLGDAVYFANQGQLWRSDGTVAGTTALTTFGPNRSVAYVTPFVAGNTIYFWGGGGNQTEVWRTDGTTAGTRLIADVGGRAATQNRPPQFCEAAGIVYFVAYYESSRVGRLWRTDGTSAGTRRVAAGLDLNANGVATIGNRVVFGVLTGQTMSLWTTDGTDAGTIRLAPSSQEPVAVTSQGIGVFVALEYPTPAVQTWTVWRTDGTTGGTYPITDPFTLPVYGLSAAGRSAYFLADDGLHRSDGTRANTVSLSPLHRGLDWMTPIGERLFFTAAVPPEFTRSLWLTDGVSTAATRLSEAASGTAGSNPGLFVPVRGGALFETFSADRSLWRSDGTESGTTPLQRIYQGINQMMACGERVLLFDNLGLSAIDRAAAGATEVSRMSYPYFLACVDGTALFLSGDDLWRTDATADGTVLARARKPGESLRWSAGAAVRGSALLLAAGANGIQVWRSDGTSPGTTLVRSLLASSFVPNSLRVSNRLLYFVTGERALQRLWRSDGTPTGTSPLIDTGMITILTDFDGLLLFEWSGDGTPSHPSGIYATDGDLRGTQLLREAPATGLRRAAAFGRNAWISGAPAFRTDGTPGGTFEVSSLLGSARLFGSSSWLFGLRANEPIAYDGLTFTVPDVDIDVEQMSEANGRVLARGGLPETGNELLIIEQPFAATDLEPAAGTTEGGERVTIHGKGFIRPVDVSFDGIRADVLDVAADAIVIKTPAGAFGAADVRIENGDGRVSRKPGGFQYRCLQATASAEMTEAACPTAPVQLHGGGGVRCTWAPSIGLDDPASCNPIATAFETITYTLVAHDATECAASTRVTVARRPAVTPRIETALFAGAEAPMTASVPNAPAGATFAWSIEHGRIVGSPSARTITFVGDCSPEPVVLRTTVSAFDCPIAATVSVPRSAHPTITRMDPPRGNIGTPVTLNGNDLGCTTEILFGDISAAAAVDGASVHVRVPPGVTRDFLRVRTSIDPALITRTNASFIVRGRTDFNRDGYSDIVWREQSGSITEWRMNGATVVEVTSLPRVDAPMKILGTGDFDGDGLPDLAVLDPLIPALFVGRSNRPDEPLEPLAASSAGLDFAGVGDFDDDGRADLLWRAAGGKLAIDFLRDGLRVERTIVDGPARGGWTIAAIDDFDGDGKSDILWHNARTDGLVMGLMNGAAFARTAPVRHDPTSGWTIATTNDFDGDGRADIVWHRDDGAAMLWTMKGETIASSSIIGAPAGPEWRIAGSGDFDHDARADLLQRNASGALRILLMNGATVTSSRSVEKSTAGLTLVSPLR